MRVIDHRQFRLTNKQPSRAKRWLRLGLAGLGGLAGLFVLLNVVMLLLYRNKVLPNYSLAATPVGNISFDQLDERVDEDKLLPAKLSLAKEDKKQDVTPKDLGVVVDWPATRERLKKARSWLPVASLFSDRSVPVELKLDNGKYAAAVKNLETAFTKAPLPERIVFEGQDFAIAQPEPGYSLDVVKLRSSLVRQLEQGKASLGVPTTTTTSTAPTGQLGGELGLLQSRLTAQITFMNAGRNRQLSRAEIGRFYEPNGQTMQLSATKAGQVVADVAKEFGIAPVNQNEAVNASYYALLKAQPVKFLLAAQGVKVYHYCTAVKGGVSAGVLPEYRQKLAATYGDPRGWNHGSAAFVYAESGCDFTAWLSAPESMTSFGGVCDSYYSCRVGTNVVVNYARWQGATDPWNAAGGSLEDYRVMVINHETGHWLGFGHRNCPAAGQAAPVMQQQSISLQGCTFNPWPTAAELADL